MTDQLDRLALDLRELASDDVPVGLDHQRILDEGGRRVRRRRVAVVASAVVVAATVAVGAVVLPGAGDAPSDGGPTRGVDVAAQPTASSTTPPTEASPSVPTTAPPLEPGTALSDALAELVPSLSTTRLYGLSSGQLDGGRQEAQADVGAGGRTGYVGVVVQRTVDPDLCTTVLRPHEAQGRTCAEASDAEGSWARIAWTDSRQGAVVAVRVVDGDREAVVATSAGVPPYSPYVDGETDPDELPWGSHSQDDAGNVLPPDPPLEQPPLDDEGLLAMARALLTLELDLTPGG